MKKILLAFCAALLSSSAFAQNVNFGINAGINFSSFRMPNFPGITQYGKTGFQIGAVADVPLNQFSIQPGLFYITKGDRISQQYNYDINGSQSNSDVTNGSVKLDYVELPVNLLYHLKVTHDLNVYFGAGGYLAIAVDGVVKQTTTSNGAVVGTATDKVTFGDLPDDFKNTDYGVDLVVGERFKHYSIEINYKLGLANTYNSAPLEKQENRVLGISLGYMFK